MTNYALEEILPLLEENIRKYTSNESTSVRNDTAKRLLRSILYCLDDKAFNHTDETLNELVTNDLNINEVYHNALKTKKEKIIYTKRLYDHIMDNFYYVNNRCYLETIRKGFPCFFERYDIQYDAENHILTLDYPLYQEVTGLCGIDLIYEYLSRIQIEQELMSHFEQSKVKDMLYSFDEDYQELIYNLCKVVLRCALGLSMINKDIYKLVFSEDDLKYLTSILSDKSQVELESLLNNELERVLKTLEIDSDIYYQYFRSDLHDFSVEILNALKYKHLEQVFPSRIKQYEKNISTYQDGIQMNDEELRKLIDEVRECRYISDKLSLVNEHIHSLSDLKELLSEAFFTGEYLEVFWLLQEAELKFLYDEISERLQFSKELEEWENEFILFYQSKFNVIR
ncbi:DUF6179 domain-containing protein [Anaeromicropila herbilytica]|uniref:Uncharacterized protein n=1 Tax=Anaeromicropila herbilytica TaxID=2785025 RepID=A0A7R7ID84_9FIRM|nr:DUF6179 domain-containing protein [Anaeromicropila herbilytica]BCN30651.1 hypothetical protein bsdtb5_19460 [Anaeromicropila herbilytica]